MKKFIERLTQKQQITLDTLLSRVIFPLYEATTGRMSPKTFRKEIAASIEQSFGRTEWYPFEETSEDGEERFVVSNVFHQAHGDGAYYLHVTISQTNYPSNIHTLELSEFLKTFKPVDENILIGEDH